MDSADGPARVEAPSRDPAPRWKRSPDISYLRVRSADFQSAFNVFAATKPTTSRRSGLLAFRAEHEICGVAAPRQSAALFGFPAKLDQRGQSQWRLSAESKVVFWELRAGRPVNPQPRKSEQQ